MKHASPERRRLHWWAAVVAVTVAVTSATVVAAVPAQARCNGVDQPVTMVLRNNNEQPVARERPASGTCNNNAEYGGAVQDSLTDGKCATIIIRTHEGGSLIDSKDACITGDWVSFRYRESDKRSFHRLTIGDKSVSRDNWGF